MTWRHSSSVTSSAGRCTQVPALLTSTSTRPNAATASRQHARHVGRAADVGPDRARPDAALGQLASTVGRRRRRRGPPRRPRRRLGQGERERAAEPAVAPGDDGGTAGESEACRGRPRDDSSSRSSRHRRRAGAAATARLAARPARWPPGTGRPSVAACRPCTAPWASTSAGPGSRAGSSTRRRRARQRSGAARHAAAGHARRRRRDRGQGGGLVRPAGPCGCRVPRRRPRRRRPHRRQPRQGLAGHVAA